MTRSRLLQQTTSILIFALPGLICASPTLAQTVCYAELATLQPSDPVSHFGWSTDLEGDTLIVGDTGADGHSQGDGAAYVFVRSGGVWVEQAKLFSNFGFGGEDFGQSVALSGDRAVVGAWLTGHGGYGPEGAAFVFVRNGTTWTLETELTASDGDAYDFFGADVAIEGDLIAVGADYRNRVYIYERNGSAWVERTWLQTPLTGGLFGGSVDLEGNRLFVGSPRADLTFDDQGAVFAYEGSGASWSLIQTITAPVPGAEDYFGASLDAAQESLIVGAPGADLDGPESGTAHVFVRSGASWSHQAMLRAPAGAPGDEFGLATAIAGDLALVGAPRREVGTSNSAGAVEVYSRAAMDWNLEPQPTPSSPGAHHWLGQSVAISGETLVAGAPIGSDSALHVFVPYPRVGQPYCLCAAGPCGNQDVDAGCANATGEGASLLGQRGPTDADHALLVTSAAPMQFGIFFQADQAVSLPFGDGVLCATGNVIRLTPVPIRATSGGAAAFGPCFSTPSIPDRTGVVPGSGDVKRYQFWYRDPGGPCGAAFNLTNGLSITW